MSGKIMAICWVIWVFGMILGSTYAYQNTDQTWVGTASSQSIVQHGSGTLMDASYLLNFSNATQTVKVLGTIPLPLPNPDYFKAWFGVVTMQFGFLMGNPLGVLFWLVILMPISIIAIVGMVSLFLGLIRGNISWI